MKTINQVNGRIKNNQSVKFYVSFRNDHNNWRNKYFGYKRKSGTEKTPLVSNGVYSECNKELHRLTGEPNIYRFDSYKHEVSEHGTERYFQFTLDRCFIKGITIRVFSTNFKPMENLRWQVKSNKTIQDFDAVGYFKKHILPKYLYQEGTMRLIQVFRNLNKQEAIKYYKKHLYGELIKPGAVNTTEMEEVSLKKRLLKLNIQIREHSWFTLTQLRRAIKHGYQKQRKILAKAPNIFEIYEEATLHEDTENGILKFCEEEINDHPKNTLFV